MSRGNPVLTIALGVVLLAISFVLPGATREAILRVAGAAALLMGTVTLLAQRR